MEPTVVFPARMVRTMNPAHPTAEAVAVRGSRIRAVGDVAELMEFPSARIDERYRDAVLLPGFVEAHSHAGTGNTWSDTYVGLESRTDPAGNHWPGCSTPADVIDRLRSAESKLADPTEPLLAWGLDPLHLQNQPLAAAELDRVSTTRPIHVLHANAHVCAVNSAALERFGIGPSAQTPGVLKAADGMPTGELQEFAAMALVAELNAGAGPLNINAEALENFGQEGVNTGTTTLTDLGTVRLIEDDGAELYQSTVNTSFPARLNVFHFGVGVGKVSQSLEGAAQRLLQHRDLSTDKLRLGNVKLMLDGSIQGFTARLLEPGYYGDQANGMWNVTPEEFYEAFEVFHRAGLLIHVHCNGDQATQLFLDTLEAVLTRYPRPDHRHTCTHSQLSTADQYKRMKALGACANIFANHIWSWGDQHVDFTVGPDRARQMNAAATASRIGVPISLHSDSPVTPLGPLHTVKHAVTRLTMSGRVMGASERLPVQEALEAVTIGGAFMLKMDHEVGSLEGGKFADMAVLSDDPLAVSPQDLGAIHVWGTVVGGEHHTSNIPAPSEASTL